MVTTIIKANFFCVGLHQPGAGFRSSCKYNKRI